MTCMVHDRKNTHISLNQDGGSMHVIPWKLDLEDGGSMHVIPRKLDLDQMSIAHMHTEIHKCDQTHFLVANFYLGDSDDICDPE